MLLKEKFFEIYSDVDASLLEISDDKVLEDIAHKLSALSTTVQTKIVSIQNHLKTQIDQQILEQFIYSLVALFDKQIAHFLVKSNTNYDIIPDILNKCCLEYSIFHTNNIESKIIAYMNQFNESRSILDAHQRDIIAIYLKLLNICFYDLHEVEQYQRKLYRLLYQEEPSSEHRIFSITTCGNYVKVKQSNTFIVIYILLICVYVIISSILWMNIFNIISADLHAIETAIGI